jgi:hypothetical protein
MASEPVIQSTIYRLAPIIRPLYHLFINIPRPTLRCCGCDCDDMMRPTLRCGASEKPTMRALRVAADQGLTLVHFSAQRQCFLWDRGCIEELPRGCLGGVKGY